MGYIGNNHGSRTIILKNYALAHWCTAVYIRQGTNPYPKKYPK